MLEEGVAVLGEFDAHDVIAGSTSTLAWRALMLGAYDDADRLLNDALHHARVAKSPGLVAALVLGNRGDTALLHGRLSDARAVFAEQLTIAQADGMIDFYQDGLYGLAALAGHNGDETLAAALEAASYARSTRTLDAFERPVFERIDARFLKPARERLGTPDWERAAAHGANLTADCSFARDPAGAARLSLPCGRLHRGPSACGASRRTPSPSRSPEQVASCRRCHTDSPQPCCRGFVDASTAVRVRVPNDRDLDGARNTLLEIAPRRPCRGEQSRTPILDPAQVTRIRAEPLGCSGLGERVAVDQHRGEQHLFVTDRLEVLLQADLVGAMRRAGR